MQRSAEIDCLPRRAEVRRRLRAPGHRVRERLLYMMQDSRAHLLLTQNHLLDRLPIPDGLSCLCLDREQEVGRFPMIQRWRCMATTWPT